MISIPMVRSGAVILLALLISGLYTVPVDATLAQDRYTYCKAKDKSKTFASSNGIDNLPTDFRDKCPKIGIAVQNVVIVPKKIDGSYTDLSDKAATDFGTGSGKTPLANVHVFCLGLIPVHISAFGATYKKDGNLFEALYNPDDFDYDKYTNDEDADGDDALPNVVMFYGEESFLKVAFRLDSGDFGQAATKKNNTVGDTVAIKQDCTSSQVTLQSLVEGSYGGGILGIGVAETDYTFHWLMDLRYYAVNDTDETLEFENTDFANNDMVARIVVGDGIGGTGLTPTQQVDYELTDDELPSRGSGVAPGGRAFEEGERVDVATIKSDEDLEDVTAIQNTADGKNVDVLTQEYPFILITASQKLYGEFTGYRVILSEDGTTELYAEDFQALLKSAAGDADSAQIGTLDMSSTSASTALYVAKKVCEHPDTEAIVKTIALDENCGNVTTNVINTAGSLLPNN